MALAAWHVNPDTSPAGEQASSKIDTQWQKWINQDVVYIISDEEKAAFERLKTDEEREHFVEQFWARRDPTPGTPVNEFREEHYRRISYANQHFRTASGTPGWHTDRGRMYIVYGPPDEIDAHPNGTAKISHPFESWGYRHVDGLGDHLFLTFVEQTGRGDYRLAPGNAQ
jgi:GWxTD domain-containing protein